MRRPGSGISRLLRSKTGGNGAGGGPGEGGTALMGEAISKEHQAYSIMLALQVWPAIVHGAWVSEHCRVVNVHEHRWSACMHGWSASTAGGRQARLVVGKQARVTSKRVVVSRHEHRWSASTQG